MFVLRPVYFLSFVLVFLWSNSNSNVVSAMFSEPTQTIDLSSSSSSQEQVDNNNENLMLTTTTITPTEAPENLMLQHFAKRQEEDGDSSSSGGSSSESVSIDPDAPAGGVSMIFPNMMSSISYFKILAENTITFSWSLTSLSVSPETLTVQAYCDDNGSTYNISPQTGLPGDASSVEWSPAHDTNGPFREATYTMRIFDENGYTAVPSPGYLRPYAGTLFGLYSPEPYTALAEGWTCVACTGSGVNLVVPSILLCLTVSMLTSLLVWNR